ncbi:TolC family protein [Aureibacter tunicatorum]|uniref:NodT family efflux transporter outer membrane factor (OMF) lipoprotein n=1 Tax=Aureibacter tunicatorum TaxID=866807 RepID=A0AAE3XL51_9BACT|nr:TolC family protein [Aureibacter tunicatorum]MDR6238447.1 NodT family efflux transporter outer membrane factor (OMF) lipoprotein [Aureibacter tunicatorum]BDD05619.1 MarR family transcriptional regulator [Aureibacter tunicatorum]
MKRARRNAWVLIGLVLIMVMPSCRTLSLKKQPQAKEQARKSVSLQKVEIPDTWIIDREDDDSADEFAWVMELKTPKLDSLMDQLIAHNADLQASYSRMEMMEAGLKVSKSELFPKVGFAAAEGTGLFKGKSAVDQFLFQASWEPDLWGKLRYEAKSAESAYFSAQHSNERLLQVLLARLVRNWHTAQGVKNQQEVVEQMLDTALDLKRLTEHRLEIGIADPTDLNLLNAEISNYYKQIEQIEFTYGQVQRSIEVLVGEFPDADIMTDAWNLKLNHNIPENLSANLLDSRPDIMAAQFDVERAFYDEVVAQKLRLPSLKVSAPLGVANSDVLGLKSSFSDPLYAINGAVNLPVFSGGALKANIEAKNAVQKESVANYSKVVLNALAEVENSLSANYSLKKRRLHTLQAIEDLKEIVKISSVKYEVGQTDMLSLHQYRMKLLNEELNLININTEDAVQRINLFLSLGGNFDDL